MIAIVGGGPAGIALASQLDLRGLAYDLFEAGRIGATWRAAPPDLRVLSPWWTNVLRLREAWRGNPLRKPGAGEYLDHLLDHAAGLRGNLIESCEVRELTPDNDGRWHLRTDTGPRGPYSAVVLATGYFATPAWPSPLPDSDGSLPMLHASQIQDYAQLESLRAGTAPIVVVGRRVTAGQLMVELHKRGIACALSLRSPIQYRRHGAIAALREALYFFWEALQARIEPGIRRPSYPVMDGGLTRTLVESGEVAIWPPIRGIDNGEVVFDDGRRLRAAAVVMATGYRASLSLLPAEIALDEFGVPFHREFEVDAAAGIYLLGFDNLYDHRSRYLRGIRCDAARLARTLASRLAQA